MMTSNIEYGLKGAFKVDIYDKVGNFVETTDWFSNFITQSGLMYPTVYSFANCFRFLTIGKNNSPNEGGLPGGNGGAVLTGCVEPITSFGVKNINDSTTYYQNGTWMGFDGYATGNGTNNSSCQTLVGPSGLRFFRSWSIPTGAAGTVINEPAGYLNVQEMAVSPGSGGDPQGCFAFSRIQRNLPLKNDYRAIVSYQLQINCKNYSTTPFFKDTFLTGNADVSKDEDLIWEWKNLSGYYRQVWAGLSCIDNYGVTFIPKYGNGMEPSLVDLSRYAIYFSPDNAAFDVENLTGYTQSNPTGAWASDGLMVPLGQPGTPTLVLTKDRKSEIEGMNREQLNNLFYGLEQDSDLPTQDTPYNIRLGMEEAGAGALKTANVSNYSIEPTYQNTSFSYQGVAPVDASVETISYATMGASGIKTSRDPNYKQRAIFSSQIYRIPMDTTNYGPGYPANYNTWTGRKKTITRRAVFSPANSMGYNTRFGSMVFAYTASTAELGKYTYYPTMDTLFYDNSGRSLMQHYRLISGIYLTQRGTGVASCTVSIRQKGTTTVPPSINRHNTRKTFQGPITGYIKQSDFGTYLSDLESRCGNFMSGFSGYGNGQAGNFYYQDARYGGCSGWGAVMGFVGDDYNDGTYYYDMGIADHNTGILIQPTGWTEPITGESKLYWPRAYMGGPLTVDFYDIVFRKQSDGKLYPDNIDASPMKLASDSGFCRPTGYIIHYDNIGLEGFRLLPNHGVGTTDRLTNTYTPLVGGAYPGFSFDNGLEVYLDISWSSDCYGTAKDSCVDPPSL
jgi:hypothetical protein